MVNISQNWKEYYDQEKGIMYIYEKALLKQKMINGDLYIKMSDMDSILKEYADLKGKK